MAGFCVMLAATDRSLIYLYGFFLACVDFTPVGIRTMIAGIVTQSGEVGSALACVTCLGNVAGMITPTYEIIYKNTLGMYQVLFRCMVLFSGAQVLKSLTF